MFRVNFWAPHTHEENKYKHIKDEIQYNNQTAAHLHAVTPQLLVEVTDVSCTIAG